MSDRKVLVPQYLNQFSCIGSSCEDTCCAGWRVTIDQPTYKKYKKVRHPKLTLQLEEQVKRNRNNPNAASYAYMDLDSNGDCNFLTETKLCSIQVNLGEAYLSNVCATYPRHANMVGDRLEKSATVSCPEIARLALLNPAGIQFDEIMESSDVRSMVHTTINPDSYGSNMLQKYFWDLRIFTIQTLQNRKYKVQDRMVLLGLFYSKLSNYVEENRTSEIPTLIASYSRMFEDGSLVAMLEEIPVQPAVQMELVKELSDQRFANGIGSERYKIVYGKILYGLDYKDDTPVEETAERYSKAYEDHYLPFMGEREYILENYLVNYVYKNTFPFTKFSNPFDNYTMLVVHYAMIKLHLIGVAAFDKGLTEESVIYTLQSFSKTVEHSPLFLRRVFELLASNQYKTMAYMAILIKN